MHRILVIAIAVLLAGGASYTLAPTAAAGHSERFTVSGVVLDDAGEPISGARVDGYTWGGSGSSDSSDNMITGADGAFRLHLSAGRGSVNAFSEDMRQGTSTELTVEGDVEGVRLIIVRPPPRDATIEGRVTDLAGNPIAGAHVTLETGCCWTHMDAVATPASAEPAEGDAATTSIAPSPMPPERVRPEEPCCPQYDWRETRTDDEGRYSFRTYAGPRQIAASAPGHAQSRVSVTAVSGESVTADLKLESVPRADAVIKGRIVDRHTGLPVPGAWISLENVEWSRHEGATTDREGRFAITTLPGWVHITVHARSGGHGGAIMDKPMISGEPVELMAPTGDYAMHAEARRVASGDNDWRVELTPRASPTLLVLGYVVDPSTQKGVAGAQVNVWNQDTSDWGNAVTDATGSYRILVRPGVHVIRAYAPGHLDGVATFNVPEGKGTTRVDVMLPVGDRKWAPCDDCYGYGREVAYADAAYESAPAKGASAYEPTSQASPGMDAPASFRLSSGASESDSTRASYTGSGGGLPPYNPQDTGDVGTDGSTNDEGGQPHGAARTVPGAPVLAAVLALGAAVLVFGRRRG